jgi:ERCC4-type nuclease
MAKKKSEKDWTTYTVIKDTREQKGHSFGYNRRDRCVGTEVTKLDTGDYSLKGLEDKLCIERKASVEELAGNLGVSRKTFYREIDRMVLIPHRFLLFEFDFEDIIDFPNHKGSRIPEHKKATVFIRANFILKCITEFQAEYGIPVIFCGNKDNAKIMMTSLFKRFADLYET